MTNVISWSILEEDVIRTTTYDPTCTTGAEEVINAIETGKQTDILICSPHYSQRRGSIAGKEIVKE